MKKLYSLCLLLTMLLFTGIRAAALTTTFEWDIPGSVKIQLDDTSGPYVDLSADQTSYVYTTDENYGYIYFYAADGYTLTGAATTDGSNTYTVSTWSTPHFISIYVGAGNGMDGKTVKVNCIKTERNDTFTVDVINGLDYVSATFASGLTLDLEQGENTYNFNPAIDGNLTLKLVGISSAYSVTLDGEAVEKSAYAATYTCKIEPESALAIQVFESEADIPKDCKFTIVYGTNMEGCIKNIYNRTTGKFYEPKDMTDNSVELKGGNEIVVNLVPNDFTFTKFVLDGEDITEKYRSFGNDITFTVPNNETATLEIEGTATVYADIDFTGYILGAEGVNFSLTYNGDAIEIPAGEAISEDITVGSYTLTPENAKKYTISVSEKVGKIFFSPKEGYYIAEVYTSTGSSMEQHSGSSSIFPDSDGTTFYMVVKKQEPAYTFGLTTTGTTYRGKLSSVNQSVMGSWGNPDGLYLSLSAGSRSISFIPGYDVPALISVSGVETMDPAVYLDGAPITGAVNSNSGAKEFTFTPYFPTEDDGIAKGTKSDVQVYLTTSRPTMSGASLVLEDGTEAEFFYSPVRHVATPAGQAVISGTTMIVKPASENVVVTYKDEKVELDENGEFVFEATGNARENVVTVSAAAAPAKYADMLVDPADGATVKSLSAIKVTLPCIDPNYESMLDFNQDVLPLLTVKKGDEVVAEFGDLGDPSEDANGNTIVPIFLSEAITAAGTYTVVIPEKAFVEKAWSEVENAMVNVQGGFVTPAYSGTVTIDPDMISVCDDYTLDPESGSTVSEISVVKVTFNGLSAEDYFSGWEFPNATFTNGETTVEAIVNYDWMSESENRVMTVTPIDADEEFTPITEAGTWTMTIEAGTFTYNGETNGVITAEYTIGASAPLYPITPASGSTVENLSEIKIEFPGVTEIEYNDIPVTLTGTEYNAVSTDISGTGNSRTFSFRNPTTDGEYTVTFPAGAFTLDGEASKEASAFYTFRSSYVLTPESGSTLEAFEVVISFPHATEVEMVGDGTSILLTNNRTYASPSINCVKDEDASVPTFIMTIPESAMQPPIGSYDLIIEEGVFSIDGKPSVSIFAKYTIQHEVSSEYILTPQNGVIVYQEWGYDFAFIFDESATIGRPDASKIRIALDGNALPAGSYETGVEMNMLMFMVTDPEYCKEGVLTVNLEAGAFKIGTTPNPAIEASWTLVAPKTFNATITPDENDESHKIANIETIYINFPDAVSGEVYTEYGATLRSSDYSYYSTGKIAVVEAAEAEAEGDDSTGGVTFSITFDKTTAAGTYEMTVREGTFVLDGVHNSPELNATYYVDPKASGIEGIFADENGNITVFSIDGRMILRDAPAAEIRSLKKGIYIINGMKAVLK